MKNNYGSTTLTHGWAAGVVAVGIVVHAVAAFAGVAWLALAATVTLALAPLRSATDLVVVEGSLAAVAVALAVGTHVAGQVALAAATHASPPVRTGLQTNEKRIKVDRKGGRAVDGAYRLLPNLCHSNRCL